MRRARYRSVRNSVCLASKHLVVAVVVEDRHLLPDGDPIPAAAGPKSANPGVPKIFGPAEGCRHTFQVSIFSDPGQGTATADVGGRLTSHLNAREEVRTMMDQYKCGKCGKTAPKAGFCCGAPMKKVS